MTAILSNLADLYCSKQFHDVTMYCTDGIVKGHRLLLGAVSPFLRVVFEEQASRDIVEISLPDCDLLIVENVLRLAYEGVVRIDKSELMEFIKVMKLLGMSIPIEIIDSITGNQMSVDNGFICEERIPERHKRKCDNDTMAGASKKSRGEVGPVQQINTILNNLSKPTVCPTSKDPEATGNGKKPQTPVVPFKYLPAVLRLIEQQKAEKRLEKLVEVFVKKHILGLKNGRKKTVIETGTNSNQESNLGLNKTLQRRNHHS